MMIRMVGGPAVMVCHSKGTYQAKDGVLEIPPELEERARALGFVRERAPDVAAAETVSSSSTTIEVPNPEPGTEGGEEPGPATDEAPLPFSVAGVAGDDARYADYRFFRENGMSHEEALASTFGPDAIVLLPVAG